MKRMILLLLLLFLLSCCCVCGRPANRESRKTYSELTKDNESLQSAYKKAHKDYIEEKARYDQLEQEYRQYQEKMKPYETLTN